MQKTHLDDSGRSDELNKHYYCRCYRTLVVLFSISLLTGIMSCIPIAQNQYSLVAEDGIYASSPDRPNGAVRYEGIYDRTYFGYYTSASKVFIGYWDEDMKKLSDPVELWNGSWGKRIFDGSWARYSGTPDDHCSPAVHVVEHGENTGKILVACAEHGGKLETRLSISPEDISAWESPVLVENDGATYAKMVGLNDGTIFLFYRISVQNSSDEGNHFHARNYFRTSSDGGRSWSSPTLFTQFGWNEFDTREYTMVTNGGDEIHAIINVAWRADDENGIMRHSNIYYAYTDDAGANWKKRDGIPIQLPISEENADLVYITSTDPDHRTHSWDIVMDNGEPHLLSCDRDIITSTCTVLHHYWSDCWRTETVCSTDQFGTYAYMACAVFADCDATKVYGCVPVGGAIELQMWEYTNFWEKTEDITEASGGEGHDHFRPMTVRNGGGSLQVLWCYTEKYTYYMGPDAWESCIFAYPGWE